MLVPSLITAIGRLFATAARAHGGQAGPAFMPKTLKTARNGVLAPTSAAKGSGSEKDPGAVNDLWRAPASRPVKNAAPVMFADRRSLSAQLLAFARSKGVSIARDPWQGGAQQADAVGYSEQELIAREIKSHHEAIALYESEANSPDEQVRAFAQLILPQLQKHLAMLELLNTEDGHARR
jgi:hypothetical protein